VKFPDITVVELIDARRVIELETVQRAAAYRSRKDIADLSRIVEEMEATLISPERYTDLDTEFHLTVARCAKNQVLSSMLRWIREQLRDGLLNGIVQNGRTVANARRDHRKMLQAVIDRDGRRAAKLMADHLKQLEIDFARTSHN
jgi:GntR family transcriptional repressor for pyruvate dehydrogenase complex